MYVRASKGVVLEHLSALPHSAASRGAFARAAGTRAAKIGKVGAVAPAAQIVKVEDSLRGREAIGPSSACPSSPGQPEQGNLTELAVKAAVVSNGEKPWHWGSAQNAAAGARSDCPSRIRRRAPAG